MKMSVLLMKLLALSLSCGLACVVFFSVYALLSNREFDSFVAMPIFFVIGSVFGGLVGLPVVLLVDWKLSNWRYRYIVIGPFCALAAWLVLEGAFGRGAWEQIWVNQYFWLDWAPKRVVGYMTIGLLSAVIFTGFANGLSRLLRVDG